MTTRRDETLTIRGVGFDVHLFLSRWTPPGASRGTVLCIHALTGTRLDFEAVAEALVARGLTVICPDMIGHGRSRWTGNEAAMGSGGACGLNTAASCLDGLTRHYAPDAGTRHFLGTSWGAVLVALFLAHTRTPARRVILNDPALERHPLLEEMGRRLVEEVNLTFATADEGMAHIERRQRELFPHQDGERIAPALLRRYLMSRLALRNGRYVFASNPYGAGMNRGLPPGYPDFHAAVTAIVAERILLMFGSESPFRGSATQQQILQTRTDARYLEVAGAGHAPRLLTPYEWDSVSTFLLEP